MRVRVLCILCVLCCAFCVEFQFFVFCFCISLSLYSYIDNNDCIVSYRIGSGARSLNMVKVFLSWSFVSPSPTRLAFVGGATPSLLKIPWGKRGLSAMNEMR